MRSSECTLGSVSTAVTRSWQVLAVHRQRALVDRGSRGAMSLFVRGTQQILDFLLQAHLHFGVEVRVDEHRLQLADDLALIGRELMGRVVLHRTTISRVRREHKAGKAARRGPARTAQA